eukprot:TRINITY_DN11225_c0_g1_i1.p1 TRINITY_DN11225_c0_g1~~TRINITY_DN11225_c0_g1_i1.p1  ORF type:complete len:216 (-),score=34.78 TRINITY_DN11225_c0_g1_i1:52-636(-)
MMDQLTTNLANNIFKKYNSKTMNLINVLCQIIEDYESKERSEQFFNDVMKITFDAVLLYTQNRISKEDLNPIRYVFRYVCSSLTNAFRYGNMDNNSISRISDHISQFCKEVQSVLCGGSQIANTTSTSSPTHSNSQSSCSSPIPSQSSQNALRTKISDTVGYVSSCEFISFASKHPHFKEVIFSLVYYLENSKA